MIIAYKNVSVEEELVITSYEALGTYGRMLIKKRILKFLSMDIVTRGHYVNYGGFPFSLLEINSEGQIKRYF